MTHATSLGSCCCCCVLSRPMASRCCLMSRLAEKQKKRCHFDGMRKKESKRNMLMNARRKEREHSQGHIHEWAEFSTSTPLFIHLFFGFTLSFQGLLEQTQLPSFAAGPPALLQWRLSYFSMNFFSLILSFSPLSFSFFSISILLHAWTCLPIHGMK